ncbi:MAG TPA: hypothetical protein VJZ71_11755 [Phycisphaerae bacterium]|nr:hypothetical protein [Phycisphaerae bacterium]
MIRICRPVAIVIVLFHETLCPAQAPPASPPTTAPAADKRNFRSFRQEDPTFLTERMTQELSLDDAQREAVAKILRDHQAHIAALRQSMQSQPTEGYDKMRLIAQEMRTAREAADTARVEELTQQMRQLREEQQARLAPMREQMMASQEKLQTDLFAVLRDDQKPGFEKLWEQQLARRSPYRGPERSPQTLKALVDRLPGLTLEQQKGVEQFFRQHQDAEKQTEKGSPAERALVTKLYDGVIALLTPEQRQLLEGQLSGRRGGVRGAEPLPIRGPAQPPTPTSPDKSETPQTLP